MGCPVRLLGLPDALRSEGLEPVLVAGWATRGNDLPRLPSGSLDHHTAGPRTGYMPSLGVLTNGRSDLPGPLAQVGSPRSEPGDWRVYVIASGKANHAGAGYWAGADSNYELCGNERELVGDGSDITKHRNDVAVRVHAAFARLCGFPATSVARHAEYALPKGRKIDTAGVTGPWLRGAVAARLDGTPPTTPALEVEMLLDYVVKLHVVYLALSPDPRDYSKAELQSVNFWCWQLTSGQKNAEQARAAFESTAKAAGRI